MLEDVANLKPMGAHELELIRDIYLPLHADTHGKAAIGMDAAIAFTGTPHARRLFVPESRDVMDHLFRVVEAVDIELQKGATRFRVEHDGRSYRAQCGQSATGRDIQLRVLPASVPMLNELQMPATWRGMMLSDTLFGGGLLLIAAPQGQGKTTTASSLVASRLSRFGGMANTFEDPIELPLQGVWGQKGLCIQRPIEMSDSPGYDSYGHAMLNSLRQFPVVGGTTILFIGEIMDGSAAVEALKAAANGHLVVATIHGRSIEAALRRMVMLCCTRLDGMTESSIRELLAEVFRGIFHQRLVWTLKGTGWSAAEIEGEFAWSEEPDTPVADAVRSGSVSALRQAIRAQAGVPGSAHVGGDVVAGA